MSFSKSFEFTVLSVDIEDVGHRTSENADNDELIFSTNVETTFKPDDAIGDTGKHKGQKKPLMLSISLMIPIVLPTDLKLLLM